jgi:hypothetical protein
MLITLWTLGLSLGVFLLAFTLTFMSKAANSPAKSTRILENDARKVRKDWEERAQFWYDEGKNAELEKDQARKWIAADNLAFLLDTMPEDATAPGEPEWVETAPKAVEAEPAKQFFCKYCGQYKYFGDFATPTKCYTCRDKESKEIRRVRETHIQGTNSPKLTLADYLEPSTGMKFCNICATYKDWDHFVREGLCSQCNQKLSAHQIEREAKHRAGGTAWPVSEEYRGY